MAEAENWASCLRQQQPERRVYLKIILHYLWLRRYGSTPGPTKGISVCVCVCVCEEAAKWPDKDAGKILLVLCPLPQCGGHGGNGGWIFNFCFVHFHIFTVLRCGSRTKTINCNKLSPTRRETDQSAPSRPTMRRWMQ